MCTLCAVCGAQSGLKEGTDLEEGEWKVEESV